MFTDMLAWATCHPIDALGVMALLGLITGLVLVAPGIREQVSRHHPPC